MPPRATSRAWFGLQAAHLRRRSHAIVGNFLEDRCTHLAAMLSYYALLSLVPFLFLLLALIGAVGSPSETSFLVEELSKALPGQPLGDIVALVRRLNDNAAQFGVVGGIGLLWTSLGFLSAAESALNIVYEVPNRQFLRQKIVMSTLVTTAVLTAFVSVVAATALYTWLADLSGGVLLGVVELGTVLSFVFSTLIVFGFLLVAYRFLPNTTVSTREVLPGTVFATTVLELSFQLLPLYIGVATDQPVLQAFGGFVLLLVWLFLMANVFLFGAQINWWHGRGRFETARPEGGL